jgi:DHA2 family multidrug resistance protein-like MFS transporter
MLSLKHLATVGLDAYAIVGMLMGLLMGIAFVRRQLRLQEPLLDLRLFDSSAFCVSITVNLVSLGALIGFLFFATQLLQLVLGLSPIAASLILLPGQVCAVAAGLAIVPIAQRVAPNIAIPGCLCLAAGAFAVMALFTATALTVALAFVLLNAAVAAITSVSNDLVLSAVPADKAGSASSVSETAYEVGVVLGTTLVGGAVAAWYRVRLVLPEGVEDGAGALTATLGGAHSLAQDLPAEAGTALAEAANTAFSGGVTVASGLVAGLIVLFALYACRGLRQA